MQAKWQAKLAKILKNLIKSQGYFRNRFNKNYWAKKLRDDMNSNYNLIRNNNLQANISKFGFLVLVNNILHCLLPLIFLGTLRKVLGFI